MATKLATPLQRTASDYPTEYWNDSCNAAELSYAIDNGAVGATTNPTIVGTVMQQEYDIWAPRVRQIVEDNPTWTDQEVTWQVIEEMAIRGWKMLRAHLRGRARAEGSTFDPDRIRPSTARSTRWSSRPATSTRSHRTSRSSSRPPRPASRPWSW